MTSLLTMLFGRRKPTEGDELPEETSVTSRATAIGLAEREAKTRGLYWKPPVEAVLILHKKRANWSVRAPADMKGYNVRVLIDDATGTLVDVHVRPR